MSTVFLRARSAAPAQDSPPTLAALYRDMLDRPPWAQSSPLIVDPATFDAGEKEMQEVAKRRGYRDIQRADLPELNFLLFGVPVICKDS